MHSDAFSKRHPIVNFIFFLGAIGFGVMIQHPVYLIAGFCCSAGYYLLLNGRKGLKNLLWMGLFFLLMTAVNPLFNIYGKTLLFTVLGRPYTLEAIFYGAAILSLIGVAISITRIIRIHNLLATRRLPQFDYKGGDDRA